MKLTITLLLIPIISAPIFAQVENEELLRNPAYLIKKYNQLALQYNALVDKGRQNLNVKSTVIAPGREIRVTNPINNALERANTELAYRLQSAQSELTQANQRKKTVEARARFLEQENSQLKDKLREFRVSESDLEERSKRLVVENRRAKTEAKNFDILENQLRSKIRQLENSESDANRQLTDLEDELKDQMAILRESNDELARENSLYKENQKITDDQTRELKGEVRRLSSSEVRNLDAIEDIKAENELLLQKNVQLAQRNKELDVAVQLMDQEIHEITKMEQSLQTNLSAIDDENKALVLTIDQNRNERDALRDQIRDLENKLTGLDRRNLELSGKLGMLRDHRIRLRNEIIDVIEQEDVRSTNR